MADDEELIGGRDLIDQSFNDPVDDCHCGHHRLKSRYEQILWPAADISGIADRLRDTPGYSTETSQIQHHHTLHIQRSYSPREAG